MLDIKDAPGKIPKSTIRHYFEGAITNTPSLAACTPLGVVQVNDDFSHYADPDTDTMWIGFALGMRCAERVEAAKTQLANAGIESCVRGLRNVIASDTAPPGGSV